MSVISPERTPSRSIVIDAMNSPAFDWTRAPATRRKLVLASVAATAVITGMLYTVIMLLFADRRAASAWTLVATVFFMVGWMYLTGCLNASVRGAADPIVSAIPGGHDEWQQRLYDQTYRRCYWPTLILMSAAILALMIGDLAIVSGFGVFFSVFLLALMAPLWTMAWTMTVDLRESVSH